MSTYLPVTMTDSSTAEEGENGVRRQMERSDGEPGSRSAYSGFKRNIRESKFQGDEESVELRPDATALYDSDEASGRGVGSGHSLEKVDGGISSTVGYADRDGYGRTLSVQQRHRANRLRKWDQRSRQNSSRDRSLQLGLTEVKRMSTAVGNGGDIRTTACKLFREVTEERLLIGRSVEGMASACVYAATRTFGYPRSFDEIAHVSRVERDDIVNCYTTIRDAFDIQLQPEDPVSYLPRIATECGASSRVERTARKIIECARDTDHEGGSLIVGKRPTSVVGAALYAAAEYENSGLKQATIAKAANVHASTIRNNYRALLDRYQKMGSESGD